VYERLSSDAAVQLDDLTSWGAIGLLEAFDRYDAGRGIKFSTYAEYRIRGAMYDALRTHDSFTRRRRQLAKKIDAAQEDVRRNLGRQPRPEEVAKKLDISLEEYFRAVDSTKPVSHVSIDDTQSSTGRPLLETLASSNTPNPAMRITVSEVREQLNVAIGELPERQRQCVLMYYGKDMSLAEIAAVYNISVSRISQILSEARRRLKKKLQKFIDPEDLIMEQEK
jgi:RNA polymerase sigma factor for flagellar operon FliA